MTNETFSNAVEALASGIKGKNTNFNQSEKIKIAKELLLEEDPRKHSKWNDIKLDLDSKSTKTLREYSSELHKSYNSNIGKDIKQTFNNIKKVKKLKQQLHQEINAALDERKELEEIAKKLRDHKVQKIAGKEAKEINELGKKLDRIDKKGETLKKEEQKLKSILNKNNIDKDKIGKTLLKRGKTVGKILKAASSSSTSGGGSKGSKDKDWEEVLKDPSSHIDPKDNLNISKGDLVKYKGNSWSIHPDSNSYSSYKTPTQGFKFHITAKPDEAREVVEEMIPVLQNKNIAHKIIYSKDWMDQRIKNKGDVQALKLMTVYPGVLKKNWAPQVFEVGNPNSNEEDFFINKEHTKKILNYLLNTVENSILQGGPKLEGKRNYFSVDFPCKEFRVKSTRIHITYSKVGHAGRKIIKNGKKFDSIENFVLERDSNGDFIQINHSPYYELEDENFRESGEYKKNGNYNNSDHFLSRLLKKKKAKEVKKGIGGRFGPNTYQDSVIIGLDGKIAGAHYLPPPEGIEEIKNMINSL